MAVKKEKKMIDSPSLEITRQVQKPPTRGSLKRTEVLNAVKAVIKEDPSVLRVKMIREKPVFRPVLEPVANGSYTLAEIEAAVQTVLQNSNGGDGSAESSTPSSPTGTKLSHG